MIKIIPVSKCEECPYVSNNIPQYEDNTVSYPAVWFCNKYKHHHFRITRVNIIDPRCELKWEMDEVRESIMTVGPNYGFSRIRRISNVA